jgi:hypothetical protein
VAVTVARTPGWVTSQTIAAEHPPCAAAKKAPMRIKPSPHALGGSAKPAINASAVNTE